MADDRPVLFARLTEDSHTGWDHATRAYGGDPTTLAEVLGLVLLELDGPAAKLPKHWREWFRQAEALRIERRKSRGRRKG